jgi:hypothetical protein
MLPKAPSIKLKSYWLKLFRMVEGAVTKGLPSRSKLNEEKKTH